LGNKVIELAERIMISGKYSDEDNLIVISTKEYDSLLEYKSMYEGLCK